MLVVFKFERTAGTDQRSMHPATTEQQNNSFQEHKSRLFSAQRRFFSECEELAQTKKTKLKLITALEMEINKMHKDLLSEVQKLACDDSSFNAEQDDQELILDLFRELDFNRDSLISVSELKKGLEQYKHHKGMTTALESLLDKQEEAIDFESFSKAILELPRARGQRVQWADTLGLHAELARYLKKGDLFDGLKGLRELSDEQVDAHVEEVCEHILLKLPTILKKGIYKLRAETETSNLQSNSKFWIDEIGPVGTFATLSQFYEGPEKILGAPNPKVEEGMRREHCERPNSRVPFTTKNYNIKTCPADEWEFVFDPEEHKLYPHTPYDKKKWPQNCDWKGDCGREPKKVGELTNEKVALDAKLQKEEIISARLYTGPMYMLYNAALRGQPEDQALRGNKYETTIFCIISCVTKLSKQSKIPKDRLLYRGLGEMVLSTEFWKEKDGFRGAVECGFMSTTAKRSVALKYSGKDEKRRGTIFEIAAGRIDLGADLTWLSQYPGESEFLFPPLTCLEVVGQPRIQDGVVIFSLRANVNLKCSTLEQLVERRKLLHMAMLNNLREELEIEMSSIVKSFNTQTKVTLSDVQCCNFQSLRIILQKYLEIY